MDIPNYFGDHKYAKLFYSSIGSLAGKKFIEGEIEGGGRKEFLFLFKFLKFIFILDC